MEILIDGRANELTKGIGENIFINDFILPKEIGKFFFFDAEKIVSLADIRTADEKKELSYAYAEVLGIKKYADLKENLENLQYRIRSKSSKKEDREKADKLEKSLEQQTKILEHTKFVIAEKREELVVKKTAADKLQEQLIREGSSLSLEEIKEFKDMRDAFGLDSRKLKDNLEQMMEFAPFIIAAEKLKAVKEQLEKEHAQLQLKVSGKLLKMKSKAILQELKKHRKELSLNNQKERLLTDIINSKMNDTGNQNFNWLLHFTEEQYKEFNAIYTNLSGSFSKSFRELLSDLRKNQSSFLSISRKLINAESKEKDPVIKRVREDKEKLDKSIKELEEEIIQQEAQKLQIQNENSSTNKVFVELKKNIRIEESDKIKDETAQRLIHEITDFIQRLKTKKKKSLEENIRVELNRLMHKSNFVHRVHVIIEGEMIDIELFDKKNQLINKEGLSKGEQQLYATALLQALIEESNIQFPVFIDSPLQKFDKEHSRNIIKDFYPKISAQVILFPLIEKELTEQEYKWLLPNISDTYIITHEEDLGSCFVPVKPEQLFDKNKQNLSHAINY
ncbi:MAG: DNA sulfur modification protein DndD [Bacteroidota bacterium]